MRDTRAGDDVDMDVDEVADRLYALPADEFTAARDAEVKAAAARGDKAAIKALRKPTASAAAVNQLVREHPDEVDELIDLGDAMRAAMGTDPEEVRRLTARRRELIAALVDPDLPTAAQQDVSATLEAATADPQLGAAVRSGRLVKPLRYAGFGVTPDLDDAVATPLTLRPRPVAAPPAATKRAARAAPNQRGKSTTAKAPAAKPSPPKPDPALTRAREQVLELAGAADDAQRRYEQAVKRAVDARKLLDDAEAERAEAHKAARAAHAAAEKARRELGKLERS